MNGDYYSLYAGTKSDDDDGAVGGGRGRKMRTVAIIDDHLTADEQLATVLYARLAAT